MDGLGIFLNKLIKFFTNKQKKKFCILSSDGQQFSPAGRSSPSPRPPSSLNTTSEPLKIKLNDLSTSLLDQDTYKPVYAESTLEKIKKLKEIEKTNESEEDDDTFEFTDDDIDEALEADVEETIKEPTDNSKTPTNEIFDMSEGHYMPMTPKKSILSPSSSESVLNQSELSDVPEENPYVEMTHGNHKSLLADEFKSTYELICFNNKKIDQEPVYMELSQLQKTPENMKNILNDGKATIKKSTLKKYSSGRKNRIKDLPDILMQSQQTISDSSDADDESRSRSRFSLSDTFRPASYYLGASTPLTECNDSSDSEIVSPPPIPTSPPPLDDLTTNNSEENFSSENYDTIKRKDGKNSTKIHSSNPVLSLRKSDGTNSSRLSLPDQLQKNKTFESEYLSLSKYRIENEDFPIEDNISNTSSDYDLYNKLKMESPSYTPSETESVELRGSQTEMDLELRLKRRRPLSEESFSEIESLGSNFDEAMASSDFDQYLNNLQSSDMYLYPFSDSLTKISEIHYITPPEVFRNETDTDQSSSKDESFQLGQVANSTATVFYDSLELEPTSIVSALKEQNLTIHDARCQSEDLRNNIVHSRENSNISDQSAPYYYSDLVSRSGSSNNSQAGQTKLNNQRDVNQKRLGISHIQNPINIKEDNSQKLSLSVEFLNVAADKDRNIDSRNLCETDLQFHQKNSDKSFNASSGSSRNSSQTAVENLIYSFEIPQNVSSGDQLWEEDILWRESLRRVSHRHARSLDDLDRIGTTAANNNPKIKKSPKILAADKEWGIKNNKITRDVIYVNEETTPPKAATLGRKKVYRKKMPKVEIQQQELNENDVYVSLAVAPDENQGVYEVLREGGCGGGVPTKKKSFDIDRETIRQWDSMSSGLMKSGGGANNLINKKGLKVDGTDGQGTSGINLNRQFSSTKTYRVVS